jgi:hypothetical protein
MRADCAPPPVARICSSDSSSGADSSITRICSSSGPHLLLLRLSCSPKRAGEKLTRRRAMLAELTVMLSCSSFYFRHRSSRALFLSCRRCLGAALLLQRLPSYSRPQSGPS